MTLYAHDPDASTIVACWPTGDGFVAARIAKVPSTWEAESARRTADALTRLSSRLWLAYSEGTPDVEVDELTVAVRRPHHPLGDLLQVMEDDRVEAAHQIGRLVSRAPGRALRDAVLREVAVEGEAVRSAGDDDLRGRAQQAVTHARPDVSDTQLVTAHSLLYDDPLGPLELFTEVEPHAAAVATLRWLRAAAGYTAALVGHTVPDVVALAEAIEHEDLRVARRVLEMVPGMTDAEVVGDLLREAMCAARGYFVVCPDRPPEPDLPGDEHRHRAVSTVLDPQEPERGLLSGLIRGIHGCFRVYIDEITTREHPGVDPRFTGPEWAAQLRERFCAQVRLTFPIVR